jgi:hypothetical protein
LDIPLFFAGIPPPVWVALSGAVSGVGGWLVSVRKISAAIERSRVKMILDASAGETAERAAFRATLMVDITNLRLLIKECDTDRDLLRARVNTTEGQILVLKASNEIMERWVAFFKDRSAPDVQAASITPRTDTA